MKNLFKKSFILFVLISVLSGCGVTKTNEKNVVGGSEKAGVVDSKKDDGKVAEPVKVVDVTGVENYSVSADSVLLDGTSIGFNYQPEMVSDKDFSTAWCSKDGGKTGKLTFDFSEKVSAEKFGIVNGFARDEKIFAQNNRVKKIKVTFDGKDSKDFDLTDVYGMQFVKFTEKEFNSMTIEVADIYAGSKYKDTCISEVDFNSDYVKNSDAKAALDYYKKNKEKDALRPYDIVGEISVSNAPNNKCGASVKGSDMFVDEDGLPGMTYQQFVYVTAVINEFGKEGDEIEVKWFYDDLLKGLVYSDKVRVYKSCDGKLYASAKIDLYNVPKIFGERGMGYVGGWNVQFYKNDKFNGSQKYSLWQ